jgi:hypothetical protein
MSRATGKEPRPAAIRSANGILPAENLHVRLRTVPGFAAPLAGKKFGQQIRHPGERIKKQQMRWNR